MKRYALYINSKKEKETTICHHSNDLSYLRSIWKKRAFTGNDLNEWGFNHMYEVIDRKTLYYVDLYGYDLKPVYGDM